MIHKKTIIPEPYAGGNESVRGMLSHLASYKTALYIGAKGPNGGTFFPELLRFGYDVTIVEAWKPNCKELERQFQCKVVNSPIQDFLPATTECWDVIIWWHGPEYLIEEELPDILEQIQRRANHLVILGSLTTNMTETPVDGNTYEIHHSVLTPGFYAFCGYNTHSLVYSSEDGCGGNHIIAWVNKDILTPIAYYDQVFSSEKYYGPSGALRDGLYKWALGLAPLSGRILDVGCGPGRLLELAEQMGLSIDGVDYSPVAVELAKKRVKSARVFQEDIFVTDRISQYDCFFLLELLEHVMEDIDLIEKIPSGKFIVASVPTFDDFSHVRFFQNLQQVDTRYRKLFSTYNHHSLGNVFGFFGIKK